MPKRSSKAAPKREGTSHDFTVIARRVVEQAIGERLDGSPLVDPAVVRKPLRRAGGLKGGKARAQSLTAEQRQDIAKIAANARWKK